MELVLDEKVFSADETKKLGIATGDYVCFDPRTRITETGYIKSRFLDDKLSAAILMGIAKAIKTEKAFFDPAKFTSISPYLKKSATAAQAVFPPMPKRSSALTWAASATDLNARNIRFPSV